MFYILVPVSNKNQKLDQTEFASVTSKFTDYLLFTVDCHQQIYRIFAIDSRLSTANLPNICY